MISEAKLIEKQDRLLRAIAAWPSDDVPTPGALADVLGYRAEGSVRHALKPLEAYGLVERTSMRNGHIKPIRLTAKGLARIGVQQAPEVLEINNVRLESDEVLPVNPASCGPLVPVAEEPVFVVERLGDVFHSYNRGDELLIAAGDSMVSPGGAEFSIYPGDRCLLRPDSWPLDGDTVYVEYIREDGVRECTLKDWYLDSDSGLVTLMARNPEYAPIERAVDEVVPKGVVLEIIRKVRAPQRSTPALLPGAMLRSKALKKKPGAAKRPAKKLLGK